MGKKLGVVYDTVSKEIRRFVISDDDVNLTSRHAGPGESFLLTDKIDGQRHLVTAEAAIQALVKTP